MIVHLKHFVGAGGGKKKKGIKNPVTIQNLALLKASALLSHVFVVFCALGEFHRKYRNSSESVFQTRHGKH